MISERWSLLEASFQMVYGIDLAAAWGTLGVRRIWALVSGLPKDAPVWREEMEEQQSWTRQDEFIAQAIERMDQWFRALYVIGGGKLPGRHTLPGKVEYPRPKHIQEQQKAAQQELKTTNRVESLDQMNKLAAFFGRTGKAV